MSEICIADVERLANQLGFSCVNAPAVLNLRNPLHAVNWTLPMLELVVVAGAVLSLVLAIKRQRAKGDPTDLALWFSGIVYVLVIEPPIYFPQLFGLGETIGIPFVHNVFTIELMFDRLPLYIIALYPAMLTLAYQAVRALGVFERSNALVGALCVGFVHSLFYEIFDHIGPQLRWWTWNTENDAIQPLFGSVPLASIALFSAVAPALLAYLVLRLVAQPVAANRHLGVGSIVARTVVIGVAVPAAVAVFGIPAWIFSRNPTAQATAYWVEIAVIYTVGAATLIRAGRPTLGRRASDDTFYTKIFGSVFLITMTLVWGAGLPAYLDAQDGLTPNGTPTGILAYAAVCLLTATLLISSTLRLQPAGSLTRPVTAVASSPPDSFATVAETPK